jgi:hypothetical protein
MYLGILQLWKVTLLDSMINSFSIHITTVVKKYSERKLEII